MDQKKYEPHIGYAFRILVAALLCLSVVSSWKERREGQVTRLPKQLFEEMLKAGEVAKIEILRQKPLVKVYPVKGFSFKKKGQQSRKPDRLGLSATPGQSSGPGFFGSQETEPLSLYYYLELSSPASFEPYYDKLRKAEPGLVYPPSYFSQEVDWVSSLYSWAWMLLILLIIISLGSGFVSGGDVRNILEATSKSRILIIEPEDLDRKLGFGDIAGYDEVKAELMEVVEFLRDLEGAVGLGGRMPKGVLMQGPPGTGKTLFARAISGEAGVAFLSLSGADFQGMYWAEGSYRADRLFAEAKKRAPCIIFIDEIDSLGKRQSPGSVNEDRDNTLNKILVEMDGFSPRTGIVVIAATNEPDKIDKALLRPGRFDRRVTVGRPPLADRVKIFRKYLTRIVTDSSVSAEKLAELTPYLVGADIENICNEAALWAHRQKKESVGMEDFHEALSRHIAGVRRTQPMDKEEQRIVAYHEAGHAVVSWYLEHAYPLLKVTIMPRADSLGHAHYLPNERMICRGNELLDQLCVSLAGRASEEVEFQQVSTGAADDLDKSTRLAYRYIAVYGLHPDLPNLSYQSGDRDGYLDSWVKPFSEETGRQIDHALRTMVNEAYQRALDLVREKREEVKKVAEALIEKEELSKHDLEELIGARPGMQKAAREALSSPAHSEEHGEHEQSERDEERKGHEGHGEHEGREEGENPLPPAGRLPAGN